MKPAIVVTGASSGIGRDLARIAAREGSFMVLVGRSQAALEEVAAELISGGAQALALGLDLADPDAGDRIESELRARDLYCDVLVNSAGFGLFGLAAEIDRAEQLKLLDVNARALTDLTLRFLPGMVARGRGGVLNVGSITGYMPGPKMALYFASKAYVRSFSAALAAELAGSGVTVTCLAPGVVRTAFFERCAVGHTRLFKIAPRSNADATAAAGWRGFRAGKRVVIPRLVNRMIASLCIVLPDRALARLIFALQRPR
jgi:short-subunit dehydrogenase